MTPEQALEIREFTIKWIRLVVSRKKTYQQKLIDAVDELFPENIGKHDAYDMLDCKDWDNGEEYEDKHAYSGKSRWPCLGDRMTELVERENSFSLTKKGQTDLICTLRVAVDMLVKQSGGVVGYMVGDLRKVFDGKIPREINKRYTNDISKASDDEPIWL